MLRELGSVPILLDDTLELVFETAVYDERRMVERGLLLDEEISEFRADRDEFEGALLPLVDELADVISERPVPALGLGRGKLKRDRDKALLILLEVRGYQCLDLLRFRHVRFQLGCGSLRYPLARQRSSPRRRATLHRSLQAKHLIGPGQTVESDASQMLLCTVIGKDILSSYSSVGSDSAKRACSSFRNLDNLRS